MKFLVLLVFLATGCGLAKKGTPEPPPSQKVTPEQRAALLDLQSDIRSWARGCSEGIACGTHADGRVDDGDSMLWAGLLCLSGEQDQCDAVKASIDVDDTLCRNPDCSRDKNSSSRDMLLGFLAYLAKTRDHTNGMRVHDAIVSNDYKICDDATDNRCDFNHPQYDAGWNLWYQIWKKSGFKPSADMEKGSLLGETITSLQSVFAPEGYQLHLVASELWIHQEINDWNILLQNAADQVLNRQPNNPFYEYVANGATSRAASLVLQKCPRIQPAEPLDWAWRRTEIEQAWTRSKGWDCIFMINLLTK